MALRVSWFLILCSIIVVSHGVLTARGYYCRDPDTGKLYPVNSTWSSTTFCGSYRCKLRKKNQTETQIPMKHIDITNSDQLSSNNVQPKIIKNCSMSHDTDVGDSKRIEQVLHKENFLKLENFRKLDLGPPTEDGDRYLTEEEIAALILILKAMKKSDLEALLEIYSLAESIYKEVDKKTEPNEKPIFIKDLKGPVKDSNSVSYWYEPLSSVNLKAKDISVPAVITPQEIAPEGNRIETLSAIEGTRLLEIPVLKSPEKTIENSHAHFGSSLAQNDFGKLPYYYPVTKFQKQSSYVHSDNTYRTKGYLQNQSLLPFQAEQRETPPKKCCKTSEPPFIRLSPWYKILNKPYAADKAKPIVEKSKVVLEPNVNQILSYPFAYLQYNFNNSSPNSNVIVNGVVDNPWTVYNRNRQSDPYVGTTYLAQVPSTFLVNTDVLRDIQDEEQKPVKTASMEEREKLPEWQTLPLSANIISEVRANVESKLLPFPFRKKIKLERAGKLMALGDFSRTRRQAIFAYPNLQAPDEFEVYIEKSTCATDTEPGFFRMGNVSQPFPACCPERIES